MVRHKAKAGVARNAGANQRSITPSAIPDSPPRLIASIRACQLSAVPSLAAVFDKTSARISLPHPGAIIRRAVDDYIASLGLTGLHAAFETVSLAVGRALVQRSDAVWFISRGVIVEEVAAGRLVTVPTRARFLSGAVGLTRRQDSAPASGLEVLLAQLEQAAADPMAIGPEPDKKGPF